MVNFASYYFLKDREFGSIYEGVSNENGKSEKVGRSMNS
jgi:hypothetical protein